MINQNEIEKSIRNAFPLIFGKESSEASNTFVSSQNSLVKYAKAITDPVLSSETIRYQSIILYNALIFLAIRLFQLHKFKISDELVEIDRRFLLLYAIFVAVISSIFALKSYVDYQRYKFTKMSDSNTISDAMNLILRSVAQRDIQRYFWTIISDLIGKTYQYYDDAISEILGREKTFKNIEIAKVYDISGLRKNPENELEILRMENFVETVNAQINSDAKGFCELREKVFEKYKDITIDVFTDDTRHVEIQAAYETFLSPWFVVRNALIEEDLQRSINEISGSAENKRLETMSSVLEIVKRIQKIYIVLEVIAPVLFSIGVIYYALR